MKQRKWATPAAPQTAVQINAPQTGQLEPIKLTPPSAETQQMLKAATDPAELARLAGGSRWSGQTILNTPSVDLLTRAVVELRQVRDDQTYLRVGCHSFREFCVQRFGERLGGMAEEGL